MTSQQLPRLEHLNRVLKAIRNVNQLITHTEDRDDLLQGACNCLTETRGCQSAWIALFDPDRRLIAGYSSGLAGAFDRLCRQLDQGRRPRCVEQAMHTGQAIITDDPAGSCGDCPVVDSAGHSCGMTARIEYREHVYGILSAAVPEKYLEDAEQQGLIREVAGDLGFALHSLALSRQRDRLQESLKQAQFIIETSPAIIFRWSAETGWPVEFVSRNIERLGYRPDDFLTGRTPYASIIHPEDLDRVRREVSGHAAGTGSRFQQEYRLLDSQGHVRWVEDQTVVLRDAQGQVCGFQGVIHDVTERKRTEESLRESEARYRTLIEQTGDCLLVHDFQANLLEVNEFACQTYGYSRQELLGMKVSDLDPDYHQREQDGAFWDQMELYEPMVFETRQQKKSGQIIPVEVRLSMVEFHGERAVLGLCRDISQRKATQRSLAESERRFRSCVENANDIVFTLNAEGLFTYVSPNWMDRLSMPPEQVVGTSFEDYVHPDDVEICRSFLEAVLEGRDQPESAEYRVRRADGTWRWHVSTGSVLRDAAGRAVEFLGIARDVTERKQADQALARSEARLRAVFNAAEGVPIQGYDRNRRVIFWNHASEKLYGYSEHEAMGRKLEDLIIPSEMRQPVIEAVEKWHEEGVEIPPAALTLRNKAGQEVRVYSSHGMITNSRGEKEMFCIDVDLSERERAERALRESEQRYRVLAENYPDGALFLFDRDLRYLSADGQELARVGLSREEIIGRRMDEVFPEQAHVIVPNCRAVVDRGERRTFQITFRDNTYDNAVIPIRDAEGRILCGIAITRNVTEQKQMEQKIRQMEKMEAVGRLAGGVAHDFNNMLTVILGNTQIALDQQLPAGLRESLEEIHRAGKRSAELTSQLLAFARKQTVAPEVLDLNETLEGMLKMLRRLIGEAIDLAWMPGGQLWSVRIDPGQVSQLLANLCVNARDAIQGVGKMTIETANVELDADFAGTEDGFQPGPYVMLAVSDDGEGMDDETRARAFEPFFTTKPEGQGTGLGLATVYGIVKQNGGLVNLYSEPGKGSTFRIYLPRHQATANGSAAEKQQQILPGGNETVLLVEDDPSILRLGQTMLGRLGYTVLSARGPGEAIELVEARSEPIQLLVTDVIMPEMNGRELYDAVHRKHPETNCLYMSGYTANIIAHHGVLEEGVQFLQKPFSRRELACRVRQALDDHEKSG